jgi:hypothetical protein
MRYIPASLPAGTTDVNLGGNPFHPVLQRSNLSGLVGIEKLLLGECGLERIAVDAFRDLRSLKFLDLSMNHIKHIEDNTFRGLH